LKIQESAENYLEAILILKQNKGSVRSIDIAHYLNFSKPSVSIAMKNLRNSELITVDSDGFISLTDAGHEIADTIFERHTVLSNMLIKLGVSAEIAAEDACRMEHVISPESFNAIKEHLSSEAHLEALNSQNK
jgi:DtxR family Mn-dependent transcriptional regulator